MKYFTSSWFKSDFKNENRPVASFFHSALLQIWKKSVWAFRISIKYLESFFCLAWIYAMINNRLEKGFAKWMQRPRDRKMFWSCLELSNFAAYFPDFGQIQALRITGEFKIVFAGFNWIGLPNSVFWCKIPIPWKQFRHIVYSHSKTYENFDAFKIIYDKFFFLI